VPQAENPLDEYAETVLRLFLEAEIRALEILRIRLRAGVGSDDWAAQKLAELAAFRNQLAGVARDGFQRLPAEVTKTVQAAYRQGGESAAEILVQSGVVSGTPNIAGGYGNVRRLVQETVKGVSQARRAILRTTEDVYKRAVASEAAQVGIGTETRLGAIQRVVNALADSGVTGFVDRAGRSWALDSYVDMAVRTAVVRAGVMGKSDTCVANGDDLVIVSSHAEQCELCRPWEGQVLSLTGGAKGYPTVDEATADGLFHPNCRHTYDPYVEGFTKHTDKFNPDSEKEQQTVYEERLQQRYLERGVRKWNRRAAVALDALARKQAKDAAAAWNSRLKDFIRAVNERREGIRGEFPMKYQPERIKPILPKR